MNCAIMQPTYLPWCGYFNLIHSVDTFIFLDDVKLEKSNWQVRNRVKSANGEVMLSISVNLPHGRMNTSINQARLDLQHPWRTKHLKSLYSNYHKAPFFNQVYPFIEQLILTEHSHLAPFNINLIKGIAQRLELNTRFVLSSDIPRSQKVKDERIVELCRAVEANHYLSPVGAAQYIDKTTPGGAIVKQGLNLDYQDFVHPNYPQLYGEFVSHLSIVDMLFNCGFEYSAQLIATPNATNG